MDDNETKLSFKEYVVAFIFAIAVLWFVGSAIVGRMMFNNFKSKCTELVLVDSVYQSSTERKMAPYHGGQIYSLYTYYKDYAWSVDGEEYKVTIHTDSRATGNPLPTFINIWYNPENPSEFIVDKADDSDNKTWWNYRFILYGEGGRVNPELRVN